MYPRSFDLSLFPHEGFGGLVVVLDEHLNGSKQFRGAIEAGSSECLVPYDSIPVRSWPLFQVEGIMRLTQEMRFDMQVELQRIESAMASFLSGVSDWNLLR